ncbi:MAG: 2OG-Fe(II) oxygenase [Sphingomonadales bacterium]|nr:2OG-Fe(II) oxygenase [Sphingomonadales bacterium]
MSGAPPADPPLADRAALARVGAAVRQRLEADPSVHRVPVDRAEIFAAGGFLTPDECAHLMAMIDRVAKPSPTFNPESSIRYRTSYSGDVDAGDSFVRMIERRICDLLGLDMTWGETVQGQRYEPGQEFHAHYDWFDTAAAYWPGEAERGGQRSWTAMAYLNDMPEGGATSFVNLGASVQPQAGALLMWNNALPDGSPNPDVRHAALPVTSGVKYIITKWFRTRRWG